MPNMFIWMAGLSAAGGMALLLAMPGLPLAGIGHPLVPGAVHLFTLGALLSGAYRLQHRLWRDAYGPGAPLKWLLEAVFVFHAAGLALLLWGLFDKRSLPAYVGGHYLIPTGIVLMIVHGVAAAWRRSPGTPRLLASHLPGLGLAVAMSIGALLVMDAHTGRYTIYTPDTIAVHLLAGGYLFAVPLLRLPAALSRSGGPSALRDLVRWYLMTGVGAGGVLLAAWGLTPGGPRHLMGVALALLGGITLWVGLPSRWAWPGLWKRIARRAGWIAVGLLVLYAAIRVGRGAGAGEVLRLSNIAVLFFLTALAVPDLLTESSGQGAGRTPPPGAGARHGLWLAGAAGLLAGQVWLEPWLIRAGAGAWLAGLACWAYGARRR